MKSRPRIDELVTQAHVDHFCPGASGFPVTSHTAGPGLPGAGFPRETPGLVSQPAAAGQACGRCGSLLADGEQVRRRASGTWVHETCPPRHGPERARVQ